MKTTKTEADLENEISHYVNCNGGLAFKLSAPVRGWPDRTIIFEGGRIGFLEIKKPGGIVSPQQAHTIEILSNSGFPARIVDNFEDAKKFIDNLIR